MDETDKMNETEKIIRARLSYKIDLANELGIKFIAYKKEFNKIPQEDGVVQISTTPEMNDIIMFETFLDIEIAKKKSESINRIGMDLLKEKGLLINDDND